jgi:hypothetical protein
MTTFEIKEETVGSKGGDAEVQNWKLEALAVNRQLSNLKPAT